MLFDSHAHINNDTFTEEEREALIADIGASDLSYVMDIGFDLPSSEQAVKDAQRLPWCYAAVGVHLHDAKTMDEDVLERIRALAGEKKVQAIGEIGLDYYWDIPKDQQKKVFEEQLILAKELDVPVIVHDREAHGDTLEMLRKYKPKGILHCFSGSVEMMREVVKLGMSISLGGVVTFKNAKHSVNVASEIPLDRLMLETDAPYMAPVPFRGKRCDSSMIIYCAKKIAELRGLPTQKLLDITKENAEKMFLQK